ncbi:MAG: hypothetical protein ACTSRK_15335 [Promethearchaeota archaeon]
MKDVHKYLIIHRESGLCIFEQTFQEFPNQFDPSLLSGYLFAVLTISQELTDDDIEFIQLKAMRISYNLSEKFIMVLISSNDLKLNYIQEKLTNLQEIFNLRYSQLFQKEFSGDVTPFHSFATDVEQNFQRETQYFHYVDKRSNQLDQYYRSSKLKWKEFHAILIDKVGAGGQWAKKVQCKLDKVTEIDIAHSRKILKDKELKSQKTPKKRNWV